MSAVIHQGLPVPVRPLRQSDLERRVEQKRSRVFQVAVRPRGGARVEFPAIAARSGDLVVWALDTFGADAFVSVKPAP